MGNGMKASKLGFIVLFVLLVNSSLYASVDFYNAFKSALSFVKKDHFIDTEEEGRIYSIGDKVEWSNTTSSGDTCSYTNVSFKQDYFLNVDILYSPVVATFKDNDFRMTFATRDVDDVFVPQLLEMLKEHNKAFEEEWKGSTFEYSYEKGRIIVVIKHAYTPEDQDTEKYYRLLIAHIQKVGDVIGFVYDKNSEHAKEYIDKLLDVKAEYLNRSDAKMLFPGIKQFEKTAPEGMKAEEGFFSWNSEDRYNYRVFNHGNSLELLVWEKTADHTFDAQNELLLKKMQAYVQEEGKPKGASEMVVDWYPGKNGSVYMFKAVYTFDKSYDYGDLLDYYNNYQDEYIPELFKEMEASMEAITDEVYASKIHYLSKGALQFIFPELVGNETESSNEFSTVKEGYYTLELKDEDYEDNFIEYKYELINRGESLDIIVWDKTPKETDRETDDKILDHVKAYVEDESKPKYASSATAGWYPGYEGSIYMFKVTYTFNDEFTYEDLIDSYKDLKESYMVDLYKDYEEFRIDAVQEFRDQ